ncbi:MAG TPA: periplasmic heavy metal sensor [Blastocatellia bacterium]|nr:periplasmic heavy metal sensor [Blastocatellia bacterium]
MTSNTKTKWQVRLAALIIFVIGFIAGALAMNIYRGQRGPSAYGDRRGRFEETLDKLNLTQDQKNQVKAIFDDARAQLGQLRKESEPKFREVRKQTDERLKAVLEPEQWEQFQQIMSEARKGRSRGRPTRERDH